MTATQQNAIYRIRPATQTDLPNLLALIHQKADFDGCPNSVTATLEKLKNTLFSAQPMAYVLLAEPEDIQQQPIGFASYHFTYSTFLAQSCLWLDDIFVRRDRRNQSIGTQLIQQLCQIAQNGNCERIDWTVNVQNQAGIRFYQRIGAQLKKEVYLCRLSSQTIAQNIP